MCVCVGALGGGGEAITPGDVTAVSCSRVAWLNSDTDGSTPALG